ncbi:MAG: hypothetical protein PHR69_00940 [Sphaerochaeta sp.]|nr:hypothetical protein [Sphaerochaeta sp.]
MKIIKIKKNIGTIISDLEMETEEGRRVVYTRDLSISVEVGDSLVIKRSNGKEYEQIVSFVFTEESGPWFEGDYIKKAFIMYVNGDKVPKEAFEHIQ